MCLIRIRTRVKLHYVNVVTSLSPQLTFYPCSPPCPVVLLCCSTWFVWHFLTFAPILQKHFANIPSIYFGINISLQAPVEGCISSAPRLPLLYIYLNYFSGSISPEPPPSNLDSYCSYSCFLRSLI